MRLAVIRIKGMFSLSPNVERTLQQFTLDRLYSCTLVPDTASYKGMLQACKDMVSYGPASKEAIAKLLSKRGRTADGRKLSATKKPEEIKKMAEEIFSSDKLLLTFGVEPTFFLAPPRGGFGKKKAQLPYGPIGKNPEISELIGKMA